MDILDAQQFHLTSDNMTVLTITTETPIFPPSSISNSKFQAFHQHITDRWLVRWNSVLYQRACHAFDRSRNQGEHFQPWEAKLSTTISYLDSTYISVITRASELGDSRYPYLSQVSHTWNLLNGNLTTWSNFISHSQKDLLRTISAQVTTQQQAEGSLLYPNAAEVATKYFGPDNFYITPHELCFYYPMKLLGPVIEGIPTFKLPIHYI